MIVSLFDCVALRVEQSPKAFFVIVHKNSKSWIETASTIDCLYYWVRSSNNMQIKNFEMETVNIFMEMVAKING